MKRSKVFLAVGTCFLAIAGVAATKAHRFVSSPGYYLTDPGNSASQCVSSGTFQCTATFNAQSNCIDGAANILYYTASPVGGIQRCKTHLFVTTAD